MSVGLLFIVTIIIFVIYPSMQQIYLTTNNILIIKNDLSSQKINSYSLSDVIENYHKYESKINELDKVIRAQDRELEFITTLEVIADKYDLEQKINMDEIETIAEDSDFKKMPLQLSLEGDYQNQLRYLQNVETLPMYINIKNINMSYKKQMNNIINNLSIEEDTDQIYSSNQNIIMNITAETYWQ